MVSARAFVDLYNGLPPSNLPSDSAAADLDLSRCGDSAAVVGLGNVALDVARVLLTPVDQLKSTDITEEVLQMLVQSSIKRVYIVGW